MGNLRGHGYTFASDAHTVVCGWQVNLGIASGQIATQEAVVAALKLFCSSQLAEPLRAGFLRRMMAIQELPRLLEIVAELGGAVARRRAEQLEQAMAELPVLEFY